MTLPSYLKGLTRVNFSTSNKESQGSAAVSYSEGSAHTEVRTSVVG